MNVLSLFDGMSCGQIALNRIGLYPNAYFASEINESAIKVTQHNFPHTIQVGTVTSLHASDLPHIDLLIGGSPCQGFSGAGKADRLNFDDPRSKLFFEYVRLLREVKPTYFLLENVRMKQEWLDIISEQIGVQPIFINSKLVSAQLRSRYYWTNIPNVSQPDDRGIELASILKNGYTDRVKARALLESDSRPLKDQKRMWRRYKSTGFTTVVFNSKDLIPDDGLRYLTQTELERCQTVPEGYTSIVNRNEAASLLGNGWTIDVIAHIFNHIPKEMYQMM